MFSGSRLLPIDKGEVQVLHLLVHHLFLQCSKRDQRFWFLAVLDLLAVIAYLNSFELVTSLSLSITVAILRSVCVNKRLIDSSFFHYYRMFEPNWKTDWPANCPLCDRLFASTAVAQRISKTSNLCDHPFCSFEISWRISWKASTILS